MSRLRAPLHFYQEPMTHIYDWVEQPSTSETDRQVKEWFDKFLVPAADKDYNWLASKILHCQYKGTRYRVTGASRLGDVWLAADSRQSEGYDLRVDIALCSAWELNPA